MNKLTTWIKRHQIAAFFLITFAITWGLGFSYGSFLKHGQTLLMPLISVATCGPALAGILISAVTNTQPRQGKRQAFWITFFVSLVVSAIIFLACIILIENAPSSPMLIEFTFVIVLPVAFIISNAYSRIPGVKNHTSSLVQLRGVWGWVLLGLVLTPALILLSIPIGSLLGPKSASAPQLPDINLALVGTVTIRFLYQLFFFNATGEEVGWRGFALPRLQARTNPLVASLIISFFWAPWHFFLWQAQGDPVLTLQYWIKSYTSIILFSLIIVWICNRARGSILVAGITHAAGNTAAVFIPHPEQGLFLVLFVTALVMILVDRMWQKLPPDHQWCTRHPNWQTDTLFV